MSRARQTGLTRAVLVLLALPFLPNHAQTVSESTFDSLLQKGFQLHQNASYPEAITELQRAYQLQPHNYFVNLLLGIDVLRSGKTTDAVPYLKEASRQRPKEEFPYEYLGEAQAVLGHPAEASVAYMQALHVSPDSEQAIESWVDFCLERYRLIDQQMHRTQPGLASEYRLRALAHPLGDPVREEQLQHAAGLDPDAAGIWSELALSNAAIHPEQASENLKHAIEQNPHDLRTLEVAALLGAQVGDWAKARDNLNAIAERSPGALSSMATDWPAKLQPLPEVKLSGAVVVFLQCAERKETQCRLPGRGARVLHVSSTAQQADTLFREERWEDYLTASSKAGNVPRVWFQRGVAYASLDDCEHAIPALENALTDPPNVERTRFLLSYCYATEAGKAAGQLSKASNESASVHMMRGDILLRLKGNSSGAVIEYEQALQLLPSDPAVLERMADAELQRSNFDAAKENASRALAIDPHRFLAMQILARTALRERKYNDALPYLRQLIIYRPSDPETQVELGTACAQTGALEDAAIYLAAALQQRYPDEKGTIHFVYGTVLRSLGRAGQAKQVFAEAQQLSDAFHHNAHWERDE